VPDSKDLHFLFHLDTDVLDKGLAVGRSLIFNGERQCDLKIFAQIHSRLFMLTEGSCTSMAHDFSGHRVNHVDLQDQFHFSLISPSQPQIAIRTAALL
jgi:hypothetical protein